MKLNKLKIYSSMMTLGVLSILNGCSSKEGTMTDGISKYEYEQLLEEESDFAQLQQNTNPSDVYNQAADILLEADQKLSEQTTQNSTENITLPSIEAIQNINTFINLLEKYKESFDENKGYIEDDLNAINIKEEIAKALEWIVNGNQVQSKK